MRSPKLRSTPPRPVSRLRRSLGACTSEGAVAEVVGACCGGAVLTGWALHLGLSARLVGLVTALPIVAQTLQVVGALLTTRLGHRRAALLTLGLSRQAFLPLALLPLLPLGPGGQQVLLLGAAGAHHGLGVLGNNAWNAWAGELVPGQLRGRYFGRRTAVCSAVGGLCALAAGLLLDHSRDRERAALVLQALALLTSLSGAVTVALLARQHAEPARPAPLRWALRALWRPFTDRQARSVLAYGAAWNAACGLSAPFFALYLLRDLRYGYAVLAAEGAGLTFAKLATSPAWGRAVDRHGARPVLVVCTAGLTLSPLAWIACGRAGLWALVAETIVGGALLGGHAVASFALPLSIAPARERPFYLAAVAVAGGAGFAVTSTLGCALVAGGASPASAGGGAASLLPALLVGSSMLRVAAALAALRLPGPLPSRPEHEPAPAHVPPGRAEVVACAAPTEVGEGGAALPRAA